MADKPKDRPDGPPTGAADAKTHARVPPRPAKPSAVELANGARLTLPPGSDYPSGADALVFDDAKQVPWDDAKQVPGDDATRIPRDNAKKILWGEAKEQDSQDDHDEPTARGPKLPPRAAAVTVVPAPGEGHDAWTTDRMSRHSTVPPVRRDDIDRLRELSALSLAEPPTGVARGGALDLVDRSRPLSPPDPESEMHELYALDDLTGALRHAELILGRTPDNEQALRVAANCRARLIQLYSSKLGRLDRVVVVALGDSQLRWLGLDHRSGFLLSRIDGQSTVDELLDICGMPRLEGLKTLAYLLERGAIRLQ